MGLSARLASYFSARVRSRGAVYFSRGSVHLDEVSGNLVEATVWGTAEYYVTLCLQKRALFVGCDCPYSADYGACKHVWATLLAAEKKGFLSDLDSKIPLRLELDDGEFDNPDNDLAADDEIFEDGEEPPSAFDLTHGTHKSRVRETPRLEKRKKAPLAAWKSKLNSLIETLAYIDSPLESVWPPLREVGYIVDVPQSLAGGALCLEIAVREPKQNGELSKFRTQRIPLTQVKKLPEAADREIISALVGASENGAWASSYYLSNFSVPSRLRLQDPLLTFWFPRICQSGRCYLRSSPDDKELRKLHWDDGPGWEFWVEIEKAPSGDHFALSGVLRRGESRMELSELHLLVAGGVLFTGDQAARLDDGGSFHWIGHLRQAGEFRVPVGQEDVLIHSLMNLPHLPRLRWPPEFQVEESPGTLSPYLKVRKPQRYESYSDRLRGELFFDYNGNLVSQHQAGRGVLNKQQRRFFLRDLAGEQAAAALLNEVGFRTAYSYSSPGIEYEIAPRHLP